VTLPIRNGGAEGGRGDFDGVNGLGAAHLTTVGEPVEGCHSGYGDWQPFLAPLDDTRVEGTRYRNQEP
jgi:hypothetical protein